MFEKMLRTQIFLTRNQKELLEKESKNAGLSLGSLIRICINKYFGMENKKNEKK